MNAFNQQPQQQPNNFAAMVSGPMFSEQRYGPDRPPFVPNAMATVPQLEQFLPAMSAAVANASVDAARRSVARMFTFNQMAANGYYNQDFTNAVTLAMDFLAHALQSRQIPMDPQAVFNSLQALAERAMALAVSYNYKQCPPLQQGVPQETLIDAQANLSKYENSKMNIEQAKNMFRQIVQGPAGGFGGNNGYGNQNMQGNYGQPNQGYIPPAGNGFGGSPNLFSTGNGAPFGGGNGGGVTRSVVGALHPHNGVADALFTTNDQTRPAVAGAPDTSYNRGKYDSLKEEPVDYRVQARQALQNNHHAVLVNNNHQVQQEVKNEVLVWAPSPAQPYPIAVDTRTQRLVLNKITWSDGQTYVVGDAQQLTEKEMNEQQHTLGTVGLAFQAAKQSQQERAVLPADHQNSTKLHDAPFTVVKTAIPDEPEAGEMLTIITDDKTGTENFMDMATFNGRIEQKIRMKGNPVANTAFRYRSLVSRPMIVDVDPNEYLGMLIGSEQYDSIVETLRIGLSDPDLITIAAEANRLFTNKVNSILANQLSVASNIDSFVDDAVTLISWLKENVSPSAMKSYLEQQESFAIQLIGGGAMIAGVKVEIPNESVIEKYDHNLGFAGDPNVHVGYLHKLISFNYLAVRNDELGIELHEILGTSIQDQHHPRLYQLAEDAFTEIDGMTIKPAHVLVVTSDDVIYEIHKGLAAPGYYTISKFVA